MSLLTGEETMAQRYTATKSQSWDSNSGQCLPEALAPPTASTAPLQPTATEWRRGLRCGALWKANGYKG